MGSKRQATSDLNHENWDQEDETEERGTFKACSDNEMKTRVIKKARRVINKQEQPAEDTTSNTAKNVFSAFSGFGTAPPTSTASPFSFFSKVSAITSSGTDIPATSTATTLGLNVAEKASTSSDLNGGNAAKVNSIAKTEGKMPAEAGVLGITDSGSEVKKSENYYGKIVRLNQDVSNWIRSHVEKKPLCLLTNIFKEYEKYLEQIETEENQINLEPSSTAGLGMFLGEFGGDSKWIKSTTFTFGTTTSTGTPTVSSSSATARPTLMTASTKAATGPTVNKPLFSFGSGAFSAASAAIPPTTKPSIFGNISKASTNNTKTNGFNFGANVEHNFAGPKPTFSFGLKTDEKSTKSGEAKSDDKPSTSAAVNLIDKTSPLNSSFGAKLDERRPFPFSFGIKPADTATTFSFNMKEDSKPTTSKGFSFGESSNTGASFRFGNVTSVPYPPATVAPPAAVNNDEDDEEDQPPKVEFKQVVEEDAIYNKKCKVFVKKHENYADRGVGTLYLKPVNDSEKYQLIVRADTNLGTIILNIILSAAIPIKRMGKNNVMCMCMPTPDIDKPVPVLLRVKTAEEADELLETLEKYKK